MFLSVYINPELMAVACVVFCAWVWVVMKLDIKLPGFKKLFVYL